MNLSDKQFNSCVSRSGNKYYNYESKSKVYNLIINIHDKRIYGVNYRTAEKNKYHAAIEEHFNLF